MGDAARSDGRRQGASDPLDGRLIDDHQDQFVVIRLKVWNAGEESQALYDFAYLDYRANSL